MHVVRWLPIAFALIGCRQIAGLDDPLQGDGGVVGDGPDAPLDLPPNAACYGNGLVRICFDAEPTGALTLTSTTIDTDTSPSCATNVLSGGTGKCVVAANTITIESGQLVHGSGGDSLVLVAHDLVTVAGTLDVASHRQGALGRGADANFSGCNGGSNASGGGGGAGGSFAALGGAGDVSGAGTSTPGAALAPPTSLHGGCSGRDGSGTESGNGADGGGAVYVIAGNLVDVPGTINASGEGGDDPEDGATSGGGGGGSGGMIGLDAPTVAVGGTVFANGGGGAEGGDGTNSSAGGDPTSGNAGIGGDGGGAGGVGGNGGAGVTPTGLVGGDGVAGTIGGGGSRRF
jgi:hypothetical protein